MTRLRFAVWIPLFIQCSWGASNADITGKIPRWDDDVPEVDAPAARLQGKSLTEEGLVFPDLKPVGPAGTAAPLPFTSMTNALAFIHSQQGPQAKGLPALFWSPPSAALQDPLEELLVREGVGLYDTALAILVLTDAGSLDEARRLLDVYVDGRYGQDGGMPMELRAAPSGFNNGAFKPFDDDVYYFFDFTNAYGNWLRWGERWKFWAAHTGPNAWLANAALHYVLALRSRGVPAQEQAPYILLAEKIGQAMQRLQDKKALGGIRYGPENVWHPADTSDPYLEINSENNVSAYAAFHLLAAVTGKKEYAQSAERILKWFRTSDVWDRQGHRRIGLLDSESGTLAMGAVFTENRWTLQPEHPTDSGGTWTISSLGAAQIDRLWGTGAAYHMWCSIRARAGRTAAFTTVGATDTLAGLDFMDGFPVQESLISPEWSSGGLFALRELLIYYEIGAGGGNLSTEQLTGLKNDWLSMEAFIHQNPNPYAIGPGQGGMRHGATGFHWFSPPADVHAMASMYYVLATTKQPDPLGDWRKQSVASNQ